jgi:hypothetical protein
MRLAGRVSQPRATRGQQERDREALLAEREELRRRQSVVEAERLQAQAAHQGDRGPDRLGLKWMAADVL